MDPSTDPICLESWDSLVERMWRRGGRERRGFGLPARFRSVRANTGSWRPGLATCRGCQYPSPSRSSPQTRGERYMRRVRPVTAVVLLAAVLLPGAAAPVLAQDQGSLRAGPDHRVLDAPADGPRHPPRFHAHASRQLPAREGQAGWGWRQRRTTSPAPRGPAAVRSSRRRGRSSSTWPAATTSAAGAVINDNRSNYSIVLTAGHCSYDETNHAFATNWMFYPDFDANQTYDCAAAIYGCWTAVGARRRQWLCHGRRLQHPGDGPRLVVRRRRSGRAVRQRTARRRRRLVRRQLQCRRR